MNKDIFYFDIGSNSMNTLTECNKYLEIVELVDGW